MKEEHITTYQAKTHLSKYLKMIGEGMSIVIKRGSVPVARLVPIEKEQIELRPKVGTITSEEVSYTADCFDSLTDQELKDWGV